MASNSLAQHVPSAATGPGWGSPRRPRHDYRDQLHVPPRSTASCSMYLAACVMRRFPTDTPTPAQLIEAFGVARATAYRWVGAIKAAKGEL